LVKDFLKHEGYFKTLKSLLSKKPKEQKARASPLQISPQKSRRQPPTASFEHLNVHNMQNEFRHRQDSMLTENDPSLIMLPND
jgi:hypothetical protein